MHGLLLTAMDIEVEERGIDDGDVKDDVVDGIDDIEAAMEEDMAKAAEHIKPVKQVLSKVHSHIIQSYPSVNHTPSHVIQSNLHYHTAPVL